MDECLINTMNRRDNFMASLVLMTGGILVALIMRILKAGAD